MTKNPHIGSSFERFLAEDGILEDVEFGATKMVIAMQITDAMTKQVITKTAMAAQMQTTRAQLDRLLDPDSDSVTLTTLKRAAKALGKTLKLELA